MREKAFIIPVSQCLAAIAMHVDNELRVPTRYDQTAGGGEIYENIDTSWAVRI
jgi:hypothetical protein